VAEDDVKVPTVIQIFKTSKPLDRPLSGGGEVGNDIYLPSAHSDLTYLASRRVKIAPMFQFECGTS